ncbi:tRNA N6-adenosine threonylcarbamoyltransferase [uncultured archaeon]|nr:tRNA N6-adenosine threonylcarbamoyltransferase [uncultured archaeon]
MKCLGIESTAHTIGVGICEMDSKGSISVLANARHLYKPPAGEGIIPRVAADHHGEFFPSVLKEALAAAGVKMSDIDLFAFSQGPGIGQCLRVSCSAAKFLASKHSKPILGINHCAAHLEISRGLLGMEDPLYVYVSGANTQLITENRDSRASVSKTGKGAGGMSPSSRFLVLGETLDMGLGNLFDVFAREAKFEYPHGSEVARLAEKGGYFPLPYTVKGMNFAFAGLLTSAVRSLKEHKREDVSHSLMETAFAELCEAAERALCLTGKNEVTVCGGVAQNRRFCEMLTQMCEGQGARFGVVAPEYNADNGAMIAYAALSEWKKGRRSKIDELKPNGYWRIDEVT